jgi:hypothetical protein
VHTNGETTVGRANDVRKVLDESERRAAVRQLLSTAHLGGAMEGSHGSRGDTASFEHSGHATGRHSGVCSSSKLLPGSVADGTFLRDVVRPSHLLSLYCFLQSCPTL